MKKIFVSLKENSYPIYLGSLSFSMVGTILKKHRLRKNVILLTHPKLDRLYGRSLQSGLKRNGFQVLTLLIPEGEKSKSWTQAGELFERLLRSKTDKGATVLVLGGGV